MKEYPYPLFRGLSEEEINALVTGPHISERTFLKNTYVFQQGDEPASIYILLEGAVQVEALDESGRRTILNRFTEPGTMFAEVYAYLEPKTYDYGCLATQDTLALCIRKELLMEDSCDPAVRKMLFNMLGILSGKAYTLNQKIRIIMEPTLRQKILQYLRINANAQRTVHLSFNREDLADYLGTTRPSVSRELRNMEQDGLIVIEKNRIRIV